MTVATIDIGTNTVLLLVARAAQAGGVEVLEERAEITRLGRGIGGDGKLGTIGIERTLAALREYAAAARRHGARIAAVGTEALRRAPNAADFLAPAAEILGTPIEVIDGAREAALTFRAVTATFPDARTGGMTVVDIGGGSTEIVIANGGQPSFRTSLPLGSVRLTERFIRHDPPERDEIGATLTAIDAELAGVPFPGRNPETGSEPPATTPRLQTLAGAPAGGAPLVGVAGTVTSLAAMALALESYDPARVHGFHLPLVDLDRQIDRLARATAPEREKMIGLDPRRADVILAGALILDRIARAAGASDVRVSDHGIRWGLLHEILEAGPGA
jgi:exopolyphosphatase/guanosine-5'-triphosphate,3'-diphosphate pyrophosphatase